MYRAWSQQLLNEVRLSPAKAIFSTLAKNDMTNFYIRDFCPYAMIFFAVSTPTCNVYLLALTQVKKLTLLEVFPLCPKKQHFLAKNQHTPRKSLNFVNKMSDSSSKIGNDL